MTDFLQTLVSGIALGCLYAVLALGFVVVARASGILNLAQGSFVILGAYLAYALIHQAGLPFWVGVVIAMAAVAVFAVLLEALVVHRVTDHFAALLVTFGITIAVAPIVTAIWPGDSLNLDDPWALEVIRVAGIGITARDATLIPITAVLLLAFFLFFRFTRIGLSLRATAIDSEAAMAQGVSTRFVFGISWGIAGALGAFGGVVLSTTVGGGVRPGLEVYAFLALPVIILGGLESPLGAVVGGLIIGVVQQFAVSLVPESWGSGFADVVPYLVMLVILLIRPAGLFGRKEIRRA
ncbi:branched-chain amino acid ABC transporter permease [Microbacterium sp. CFH 90308]|uniref:Branched-chain amino acid ABC transporter permease n=1 Tax=Microbacterium salsuginis TaxID=2722803 RepID=A0ABX1KC94_9MICO|nr:branched-chain amino acid ABC transporter permease [Microbacterium sp. CFH 90308]NLP84574.1 branched-chain amino acid ABC transporter permease [Microbacterium sp. CFH 90308]